MEEIVNDNPELGAEENIPVIELKNVGKRFGNVEVFHDISLRFIKGQIYGIVGYNGSGKTVLFKCICGFLLPDEGSIYVKGEPLGSNVLQDAGIIIENPSFLSGKSGRKNLELLYMLGHRRDTEKVEQIMEKVGLDPGSKKRVKNYSLGMRQRLAIAQAIMEDPDILILDEPMNGLDRNGIREVRDILLKLKSQGKTIILASHNREDIDILCDEVFEMEAGVLKPVSVQRQ